MFGQVHTDAEGKIVAEGEGAPVDREPDEEWTKNTISKNEQLRRHIVVGGQIEPARETMVSYHSLNERHFHAITMMSPLVPAQQAVTFSLGFARLIQGDFVSAAHILVLQVENLLRYVLRSANTDSSKVMPNMLQEDRPLSALLDQMRPEMEKVFSAEVVLEIDLLFNHRPGPALRHEFAHGKVASSYCYHPDVIFACWFIYHLCCAPLLRYWREHVELALEAECS